MIEPFNTKISVFKELSDVDTPFEQTLTDIYSRIKKGNETLIKKIEKIRSSKNTDEIDRIKKSLVAIMFNGTFSKRNDDYLIEHSGMCVVDFDKYPSKEVMLSEFQRLKNDPFTLMLFVSPSGVGLKALIRIPKSTKEEHKLRFKSYQKYINSEYFDIKNCNVSRVCFESYDPYIYINQECEEFLEIEEEEGFSKNEQVAILPINDEESITIRVLAWWNKKFGFEKGSRNNNLLVLAESLNEYGVSKEFAKQYIKNKVITGGFSESELNQVLDNGYKRTKSGIKFFEDRRKEQSIKAQVRSGVSWQEIKRLTNISDEAIEELKKTTETIEPFWRIQKDSKKKTETVTIEAYKFSQFLMKNGFRKYYPEQSETPVFVHITENKVNMSSVSIIKDFVIDYLESNGLISVWNYCTENKTMFTPNYLNMLKSISMLMIKDTKEIAYIPFLNGVLKVGKKETELLDYIDVDGYIWQNQIIQRKYSPDENYSNDFQDLVKKVGNNNIDRINSMERILGYLLHSFKDKTYQKAIIMNDEEINDSPNGGSGKSLILSAISNFKRVVTIDGKKYDPKKSDFVYQRVSPDTQVLAFDDVRKNFDFEHLFSLITQGIEVNKKNRDEFFIPFERSPKIVITSNYVINGSGSSHFRRRHEIEFHQYFNEHRTPETEYGRMLFDDWKDVDWIKFDNYMVSVLQNFLNNGLTEVISINIEEKRFIQATNSDFNEWCKEGNIGIGIKVYNSEIFDKFIAENKTYKHLHPRIFMKWVAEFARYKSLDVIKERSHKGRYFIIGIEGEERENEEQKSIKDADLFSDIEIEDAPF